MDNISVNTAELTTIEFAKMVKLTPVRIGQLIRAGEISARKIGRDYLIPEEEIEKVLARSEKRGRKRKVILMGEAA